jgi:hypothetical protein
MGFPLRGYLPIELAVAVYSLRAWFQIAKASKPVATKPQTPSQNANRPSHPYHEAGQAIIGRELLFPPCSSMIFALLRPPRSITTATIRISRLMPATGCRVFAIHAYAIVVRGKNKNPSKGNISPWHARCRLQVIRVEEQQHECDSRKREKDNQQKARNSPGASYAFLACDAKNSQEEQQDVARLETD